MALGLGLSRLGLTRSSGTSFASWGDWDGSFDRANNNIFAAGGILAGKERCSLIPISSTESVLVYSDNVTSPTQPRAVVLDIDAFGNYQVETTNTALSINTSDTQFTIGRKLSSTRILVMLADKPVAPDEPQMVLLSKSGKTLAVVDTLALANSPSAAVNENYDITVLSETKAVITWSETGADGNFYAQIITADSDTLAKGTAVNIGTVDTAEYYGCCRANVDGSDFFLVNEDNVAYCTISGTTITSQGTLGVITPAAEIVRGACIERIADDACVVVYEKALADTATYVNAFKWNGSALEKGTETLLVASDLVAYSNEYITELDPNSRQAFFAARMQDESNYLKGFVISVADDLTVTVGTKTQISGNVVVASPTLQVNDDYSEIHVAYGDFTTAPTGQLATKILRRTGTYNNTLNTLFVGQSIATKLFTDFTGAGDTNYKAVAATAAGGNYTSVNTVNGGTAGASAHKDADEGSGYFWDTDTDSKGTAYTTMETAVTTSAIANADFDVVFWIQGQTDIANIADSTITKAQFKSATLSVLTQLRADFPNAFIVLVHLPGDNTSTAAQITAWNSGLEAHVELIDENTWVYDTPGSNDISRTDDTHFDQTGNEEFARRLAWVIAYLQGRRSLTGVYGPTISSSQYEGGSALVTHTITHDAGTDLAGTETKGWNVFDDGTGLSVSTVTHNNATTIEVTSTTTITAGSTVTVNYPYGGSDGAVEANVIVDNATNSLPIRPTAAFAVTEVLAGDWNSSDWNNSDWNV